MGFNTVAVLYNDMLHDIRNDGLIGVRIARAMIAWSGRHRRHMARRDLGVPCDSGELFLGQ